MARLSSGFSRLLLHPPWVAYGSLAPFWGDFYGVASEALRLCSLSIRSWSDQTRGSQLWSSGVTLWRGLEFDLDRLVKRIAALRGLPPDVDEQLELILSRKRELVLSYVDPKTDQKLLAESHGRVNAELPPNSFWKP